jgi:hypothetical protein
VVPTSLLLISIIARYRLRMSAFTNSPSAPSFVLDLGSALPREPAGRPSLVRRCHCSDSGKDYLCEMQYLRPLDTLVSMLSRFKVNEPLTKYQLRYVKLHCVPSHLCSCRPVSVVLTSEASLPLEALATPSWTECYCHQPRGACHPERGPGQPNTNT